MFERGSKSCCSPDGHCKTTSSPSQRATGPECKQIAFEHLESIDLQVRLPLAHIVKDRSATLQMPGKLLSRDPQPIEPSPPDLQALHSTFLI